jgi:arginyl-tRNA synthetase
MRDWCLEGVRETYAAYGVVHDDINYESDIYHLGKDVVLRGLEQGLFSKDEKGGVVADLTDRGLGTKVLLRSDGTAIYITQDLALAQERFAKYGMDRLVYVVANEQIHHFKVLFSLFEMLSLPFAPRCYHLSYGYVSLPSGRMKSREGTVVDADDLRADMIALAREEVAKRFPELGAGELDRRATAIGVGALKFFILKYNAMQDFVYDPKESISFQGETGPYVQYTYARISSIVRKAGGVPASASYETLTHDLERQLALVLGRWREVIVEAADGYKPHVVCTYAVELAQLANSYYHDVPVLTADEATKNARLVLLDKVRVVLKDALSTLGIDVLEEM